MALTAIEKAYAVLRKILLDRNWVDVGYGNTGVYKKNHVFLCMQKNTLESQNTKIVGKNFVGYFNTVHQNDGWVLTFDGFVIETGKFPSRTFSSYFGSSFSEGVPKKLLDFVDPIDKLSEKSYDNLLLLIRKEAKIDLGQISSGSKYVVSSRSVADTKTFCCDVDKFPPMKQLFNNDQFYRIVSFVKDLGQFCIVELGKDPSDPNTHKIGLTIEQLDNLIKCGAIFAIEKEDTLQDNIVYTYDRVFSDEGSMIALPESFNDFKLSVGQSNYIKTAIASGVNFTPLLNADYDDTALGELYSLLSKGADSEKLVGKTLDVKQLQFLQGLADNGYALDAFCDEGVTIEYLQAKYSSMLEGFSERITNEFSHYPHEVRRLATQAAFNLKGYDHIFQKEPLSKLCLINLQHIDERYSYLCDVLLKHAVFENEGAQSRVYWSSLDNDTKMNILKYFMDDRFWLNDKQALNDFLLQNIDKFLSLAYAGEKQFILFLSKVYLTFDYNSVCIYNTAGRVMWRGTLINEKAYTFVTDDLYYLI